MKGYNDKPIDVYAHMDNIFIFIFGIPGKLTAVIPPLGPAFMRAASKSLISIGVSLSTRSLTFPL